MATYNGNALVGTEKFKDGDIINFDYSGLIKTFRFSGIAQIECWGAQGGDLNQGTGGKGAYTKGILKFNKLLTLHVGQNGTGLNVTNAFNGGGKGAPTAEGHISRTGGGASDIRLTDEAWNDLTSLRSRIMVAAGGGGTWWQSSNNYGTGGYAGGLTGVGGDHVYGGYTSSKPGSQTGGGAILSGNLSGVAIAGTGATAGQFGIGGNGPSGGSYPIGGGGGSGYYGGGPGNHWPGITAVGGAGGSSFISGHSGCNAIRDAISTVHTGQPNHYSGLIFTETVMKSGNESMPNPRGTGNIIGNSGNGYIRITIIKGSPKILFDDKGTLKTISSGTKTYFKPVAKNATNSAVQRLILNKAV